MLNQLDNYINKIPTFIKRNVSYLCIFFSILLISGCNSAGSGNTTTNTNTRSLANYQSEGSTESGFPVAYNNVVYILDSAAKAIYMYQANESKLETLSKEKEFVPTGDFPFSITIDPTKHFVYVTNIDSNSIYCYTIDQDTGLLTFTAEVAIDSPTSVVVEPNGKYAYATSYDTNTISLFNIDDKGILQYVTKYSTLASPYALSMTANGSYLYVGHDLGNGNNIERFMIRESGILDTANVTQATAGAYNSVLVNSLNDNWLYAGSIYTINSNIDASNNITSFALNESGSLATLNTIGKNSAITQMLLMNDQYLYVSDNYNNKIDMYKIESQIGELRYFPSESFSAINTQENISDMALAPREDRQIIFAISNTPSQVFTRYLVGNDGILRRGVSTLIPNMESGNHSADAIAVANLIPDELKVLNKGVIDISGIINVQAPADTDIDSLYEDGNLALYIESDSAPSVNTGHAIQVQGIWLIPVAIEIIEAIVVGGTLSITLRTHAEDFKDGQPFILDVKAKDKDGHPIKPIDNKKLRLITANMVNPAKKTNVALNQKQIDIKLTTVSVNPLDLMYPPRFDQFTANCGTVNVTQQPKDKSKPASIVPCSDVIISGKKGEILSYLTPDGFKYNPDSIVTISFDGVTVQDYNNATNFLDELPINFTSSFTTASNVLKMIKPAKKTNVSVYTDIIFRSSEQLNTAQTLVEDKNYSITSKKHGKIPGEIELPDPFTIRLIPESKLPESDEITIELNDIETKDKLDYLNDVEEFETSDDSVLVIYEAINNGAGFLGDLRNIEQMDYICNHDPNKPPADIHPGTYKAMVAMTYDVRTGQSNRRYACRREAGTGNILCDGVQKQAWVLYPKTTYYNKTYEEPLGTTTEYGIFENNFIHIIRTEPNFLVGAWTGLNPDWTSSGNNCAFWNSQRNDVTGRAGVASTTNILNVISAMDTVCNIPHSLYCAQQ